MTEKRNRQELIAKRNLLYWQFLNDPEKTNLAVEIKALDDQIADITQRMIGRPYKSSGASRSVRREPDGLFVHRRYQNTLVLLDPGP
jgi:hypothetical protein